MRYTVQTEKESVRTHIKSIADTVYQTYTFADGDLVVDGEFSPSAINSLAETQGVEQITENDDVYQAQNIKGTGTQNGGQNSTQIGIATLAILGGAAYWLSKRSK